MCWTAESLFLRQVLKEECSFGIHCGEPKSVLTIVQVLYVVLGSKVKRADWLVHSDLKSHSAPFYFSNSQSSFTLES